MIKIHEQQRIAIKQPIEVVFAYISNLENLVAWSSIFASVTLVSPQTQQAGAVIGSTIYFAGKRMEFTFEVIEYEPYCALTLKSITGIAPCYVYYQLAANAHGGTDLTREITVQVVEDETEPDSENLKRIVRKQLQFNLFALKDVLETRAAYSDGPED